MLTEKEIENRRVTIEGLNVTTRHGKLLKRILGIMNSHGESIVLGNAIDITDDLLRNTDEVIEMFIMAICVEPDIDEAIHLMNSFLSGWAQIESQDNECP